MSTESSSEESQWRSDIRAGAASGQAWNACDRGDWQARAAGESGAGRLLVRAVCECVRTALFAWEARYPGDARPHDIVAAVDLWASGREPLPHFGKLPVECIAPDHTEDGADAAATRVAGAVTGLPHLASRVSWMEGDTGAARAAAVRQTAMAAADIVLRVSDAMEMIHGPAARAESLRGSAQTVRAHVPWAKVSWVLASVFIENSHA